MPDTQIRRLYLVRHGEAKPKSEDPERGLTEAGRTNVRRMANWVAASSIRVDEIRHSAAAGASITRRSGATAETFIMPWPRLP